LPAKLDKTPKTLWTTPLSSNGLGGIAANADCVIVSERGVGDTFDVYRCLNAVDGKERWVHQQLAPGQLDYGSSPRATPIITEEYVYLYGAWGHLHCVELKTGIPVWQMDVRAEFKVEEKLAWGLCGTPLLVDGKIVLQVGTAEASLIALDARTGKLLWKTPGEQASYGSLNTGVLGGKKQIVGHDASSLGGWDIETGKRLWALKPKKEGDYNVPTPILYDGKLLVSTENNGTRLYAFDASGKIIPEPLASSMDLAPETHTPVVVGDHLFGIWKDMVCLDLKNGLKQNWLKEDDAFASHASIIAGSHRLLISTFEGELLLVEANPKEFKLLGRMRTFEDEKGLYSHPALVGRRLYLRSTNSLTCIELPE
jgi:outer membrane protein assembly factor BamB